MRIAFFTSHYFPHLGGVERYAKELASRVAARGHECWIVTNRTNRAPVEEEADGIRIFRLPSWNVLSGQFPITLPSPEIVRRIRAIKRWGPDWIVTNTRYFPINTIALFMNATLFRARHLHIEHGSDYVRFSSPLLTGFARIYDSLTTRVLLRRATVCVGVSQAVTSFVEGAFGRRCDSVLHNAVDTAAADLCGLTLREDVGIVKEAIVFGYAGRLIPEKGVLYVLAAFKKLRQSPEMERNRVSLLIAGPGPLEQEVARLAGEDPFIHYLGALESSAMPAFYRTVDIFVYPSSYPEGFPTVILEAGAYGKLIITTERGSTRDLIQDASFGTIVPEHDEEALVRAMADYARRFEELRGIGENLRRRVQDRFDWERTVQDFLDLVSAVPK